MKEELVGQIHVQALEVLRRFGMAVENAEARGLLEGHPGVRFEGERVFFDPGFVNDEESANRSMLAAAGSPSARAPEGSISIGCGDMPQYYRDPKTGKTALFTSRDLVNATRFLEAGAPGGAWSMVPGVARDVPPALQALTEYYIGCEWCSRGGNVDTLHPPEALPYLFEMAGVMGHDMSVCGIFTVSPLRLGGFELDTAIAFRDRFTAFGVASLPAPGASAPIDRRAAWAVAVAEALGAMVVLRLASGGKPVHVSPGLFPFDLRAMAVVGGTPEHVMAMEETLPVARRYDPGASYVHLMNTQARHPGLQAGLEKAYGAGYAVARGCRELQGAGLLGFDDIFSPEQFLADVEIRDALQRLSEPHWEAPADLWMGMIAEGVQGGYAGADATLDHLGEVCHFPKLLDRSIMYGPRGRAAEDRVREEANALIVRAPWTPPEPAIRRAREIWDRAWKDLAGSRAPHLANG